MAVVGVGHEAVHLVDRVKPETWSSSIEAKAIFGSSSVGDLASKWDVATPNWGGNQSPDVLFALVDGEVSPNIAAKLPRLYSKLPGLTIYVSVQKTQNTFETFLKHPGPPRSAAVVNMVQGNKAFPMWMAAPALLRGLIEPLFGYVGISPDEHIQRLRGRNVVGWVSRTPWTPGYLSKLYPTDLIHVIFPESVQTSENSSMLFDFDEIARSHMPESRTMMGTMVFSPDLDDTQVLAYSFC